MLNYARRIRTLDDVRTVAENGLSAPRLRGMVASLAEPGLTEVPMLRRIAVTVLLASGVASPWSVAHAQEARNPNHAVYLQYCSACHGPDGKGDGPLAAHLTPKPTDLTQLAKQSGGEFNAVVVYDAISGRTPAAHGTSAMPVWGEKMPETPGDEDLRANKLRIAKIVNYLRSIQVR